MFNLVLGPCSGDEETRQGDRFAQFIYALLIIGLMWVVTKEYAPNKPVWLLCVIVFCAVSAVGIAFLADAVISFAIGFGVTLVLIAALTPNPLVWVPAMIAGFLLLLRACNTTEYRNSS